MVDNLVKEWKEIEEGLGLKAVETLKYYIGKILDRNEELKKSRDLWRSKYEEIASKKKKMPGV